MKTESALLRGIFIFCLIFLVASPATAAELSLPEVMHPGDQFVLTIKPHDNDKNLITLRSDSTQIQYMGAVHGTPDIQIKSDSELEIRPAGEFAQEYGLRFLSLLASGSTQVTISDAQGARTVAIEFTPRDAARGYSGLILVLGVILLIGGIKLWRYQKSAPTMMSTKSLFFNFEELEKARRQYFPDSAEAEPENKQQPDREKISPEIRPTPAATEKRAATKPDQKAVAGNATVKAPAVKPEDLADAKRPSVENVPENAAIPPEIPKDEAPTVPVETLPKAGAQASTVPRVQAVKPAVTEASADSPSDKVQTLLFAMEDSQGKVYRAEAKEITIGRRKDNSIVITASEISRAHVVIRRLNGSLMLDALAENNITKINTYTVKKPTAIRAGDTLNLGGTDYKVTQAR